MEFKGLRAWSSLCKTFLFTNRYLRNFQGGFPYSGEGFPYMSVIDEFRLEFPEFRKFRKNWQLGASFERE